MRLLHGLILGLILGGALGLILGLILGGALGYAAGYNYGRGAPVLSNPFEKHDAVSQFKRALGEEVEKVGRSIKDPRR